MLYLPIWCQNLVRKYGTKVWVWGEIGEAPLDGHACPLSSHLTFSTNSSPAVIMSLPGVPLHLSPCPIFWHYIFPINFGTKLVKITFSLRPEEALLVLTL